MIAANHAIPEYPAQSRRKPAKGETVSPEHRHLKGPFRGSAPAAHCDDIAPVEGSVSVGRQAAQAPHGEPSARVGSSGSLPSRHLCLQCGDAVESGQQTQEVSHNEETRERFEEGRKRDPRRSRATAAGFSERIPQTEHKRLGPGICAADLRWEPAFGQTTSVVLSKGRVLSPCLADCGGCRSGKDIAVSKRRCRGKSACRPR